MSLVSKYFKRSVELVVIRNIFNPAENIESYRGYDVEQLLMQAFGGNGLSENIHIYHGDLSKDITPKTPQDVDKIMRLNGRIYAVVKPMGLDPVSWAIIGISIAASVAVAFLMPVPTIPNQSSSQPPSPNNALAARTNKQRLGGRIPDIYGTVWSVPDLIAPTYSVYIDSKETEYSYMCVGRGRFNVIEALDDTTPISQVFGSSVYVYDPDDSLNDTPDFLFGSAMTPDEAAWSRLAAKRYTSVNGQTLNAPDSYVRVKTIFKNPNIIETSDNINFRDNFEVGGSILVEGADNLVSANGITEGVDPDETTVTYTLNGQYTILEVTEKQIKLSNPAAVNTDWQKLADNVDFTNEVESVALSVEADALWQGWFYTDLKDHDSAYANIVAPNGLYEMGKNPDWRGLRIYGTIESELVDATNNPIAGTLVSQDFSISAPNTAGYGWNNKGSYDATNGWTKNDKIRESAATTVSIANPNFSEGKRLRFRISRRSKAVTGDSSVVDEIRIKDFYGTRKLTANDYPKGVTTVVSKARATEGALALKERKLRLLVQRYVTDATSGLPKLSNRVDDIIRHIATDPKIGNLQLSQVDIAQIKTEIDAQIAYFGTDKCSQFCGTFDDNNLSAEETMQIVAKAVFSQAKRQGNKIMLDFERVVPASVAVFNSHNILPDTFTAPQSLGIANDYDGVKVEYTDPVDDAVITMSYPNDAIVNPHEDKLIGVRNKVQAHMHMMRMFNKDQHAYKSCEFVAGDESNIVVRTNRITVADQLRADVQQGSVESIETIGGDIVLHTTDPVSIETSGAYTMFIQTINNGVESIAVTARDDYSVKLARLPSGEISGTDKAVQAVYQIVSETDDNRDAYLVAQKDPSDGMTNKLLCTNYDDRYYQNDSDFTNGLIT
ncbi:MAG: host specificity factor TipJ family phage tail protein [Psychrobacter sp.]